MSVKKISTTAFYSLVVLIALIAFFKVFTASNIGSKEVEVLLADQDIQSGTGWLLVLSIILIVILAVATFLVAPIINIIQNPKGIVKSLIGIGVVGVIFVIGYSIAGDEVTRTYKEMGIATAGQSKVIGGVIYTTTILIVLAALAFVYSSINSLLKQL